MATPARIAIRAVAVGLLLVMVVGGGYLRTQQERRQASHALAAENRAELAAMVELRRLVEWRERVDRARWSAAEQATEVAEDRAEAAAERVSQAEAAVSDREAASRTPSVPAVEVPSSCDEYGGNRAIGCALLLEWGFGLDQMPCLDELWDHESGWNERAANPSSSAYGIPQANPGSAMASHGDDWETNPATQIRWGLDYVQRRYDTPCGAWRHFQNNGWY